MKRTTINDLAKACGISKSTVSRALTQKGYVSEEVALKIIFTVLPELPTKLSVPNKS